jgi:hypothetical protein
MGYRCQDQTRCLGLGDGWWRFWVSVATQIFLKGLGMEQSKNPKFIAKSSLGQIEGKISDY